MIEVQGLNALRFELDRESYGSFKERFGERY